MSPEPVDGDVSRSETLTCRLAQLGDREWMRPVLQHAVDQLIPGNVDLEDYQIDHCKVTPWQDISAALLLTLRSTRTGGRVRLLVSAAVLASLDDARRRFQEESRTRPSPAACDDEGVDRPRAWLALVPEMSMVVRLFPSDAGLTRLGHATDTAAMKTLLASCLPDCRDHGWRIHDLACEPVQYKPGRICTLRYAITLRRPRRSDFRHLEVFGKVYRDDRWRRSFALLDRAWRASRESGGAWSAARPLAVVDSWAFVLQSAVPGRQFRHVLGELTDNATAENFRQLEEHVSAVARAAAALQHSAIGPGPYLDFAALLAAQRENLMHLHGVHPDLARELHRVRTHIEREAKAGPAARLVSSHGDFAHGNVLLDEGHVGIIDFDRAAQAEPAYDIAYFLTHLASFSMRHPERAASVRRLCERLRASYLELVPSVTARRLAVYEALDLSAYVLRNFRKRSHQPEWMGWANGQVASAWERLEFAASSRRSASA